MQAPDPKKKVGRDTRQHQRGNGIRHLGMILIVVADFANLYWLLSRPLPVLVLSHLALAVLFIWLLRGIEREDFGVKRNFIHTARILSFLLPGYGMFGLLILFNYVIRADSRETHSFEPDEFFMPEKHKEVIKNVDSHILSITHDEIEVEAFMDILGTDDRNLEENAINKLARTLTRQSVAILKDVVKNATSDTKILAASAIIEMEDQIIEKIERLRTVIRSEPQNQRALLELARSYDLYCYLGVLDDSVKKHYQDLSQESYRKFLEHAPNDHRATLEYGRLLLNSNQVEHSLEVLAQAGKIADADGDLNSRIWLAEAHYRLGNYEKVTRICKLLSSRQGLPENIREVVRVWSPSPAEVQ